MTSLKIGKKDTVILSVFLVLVLSSFLIWINPQSNGDVVKAVIKKEGVEIYSVEMKEGLYETYEITDGEEKTVVEIDYEKGIRILSSTCPNKDCVKTGWVNKNGVPIICLPNRLEVVLVSVTPDSDGIVG